MYHLKILSTLVASLAFIPSGITALEDTVFVRREINWDDHPFIAPGEGDVRSPCPGLNT